MEALLAMMVVTVAVALLALSFSLTAHDLRTKGDVTSLAGGIDDLLHRFKDDRSIWRDGSLAWASLQVREGRPYSCPNGTNGYSIMVLDIENDETTIISSSLRPMDGSTRVADEHAWNIIRSDGTVGPGLIVLEVW